jgi:hypothetical protein
MSRYVVEIEPEYVSGWTHYPIMNKAGLSSTPTCWLTTPRHSASRIRATLVARSASFGLPYSASRCDSRTGSSRKAVILLTMFYKAQGSKAAEVERALIA